MDGVHDWDSLEVNYLLPSFLPFFLTTANVSLLCVRYQESGRDHELLNMAPHPFRWMVLVPSRLAADSPPLGEFDEIPYSWNEPGWDIEAACYLESDTRGGVYG